MRDSRGNNVSRQRGQILVLVAGGLIGLLAIAVLVLEGGTLALNRRDAQNSSDIASLAGARIVAVNYTRAPGDPAKTQADVYAAVLGSMDVNDCPSTAPCTWTANFVGVGLTSLGAVNNTASALPSGTLGVRALVTRTPGALLGRVLGLSNWTVSTEATAISAKPTNIGSGTMLPIALCGWTSVAGNDCAQASNSPNNAIDFQVGQLYDLTDGKDAPGGFGWLSWTGSNSAGALADSICTPNNIPFTLDTPFDSPGSYGGTIGTNPGTGETWFPVDPGKTNSNDVRACLDGKIGQTVLIPVYDLVTGSGNNAAYHITGVAAFVLYSRDQPAVDNIQGHFKEYYAFSSVPGGAGTQPPDSGDQTVFIGLVR